MHSGARPFQNQREFEEFLQAMEGEFGVRNRALVTLSAYAGLRIQSVLSLRIGDVFDGHRFRKSFRVARKAMKGKRGSFVVPLHPRAAFALGRWLILLRRRGHSLSPNAPIFCGQRGETKAVSVRMMQKVLNEVSGKVGAEGGISTHSCRKFFAKRVYERSGNCLVTTAQALAHGSTDLRTTARYLAFQISERADAIVRNL